MFHPRLNIQPLEWLPFKVKKSDPRFRIFLLIPVAESADVPPMKVIVQDIANQLYLAAHGAWVADAASARDFRTLLRAFHFATDNVACRFQVLLYCEDDDYVACIIEGEGKAEAAEFAPRPPAEAPVTGFYHNPRNHAALEFSRGIRFDETRNHLN